MAMSVLMHGSRRLPVINSTVSKLLCLQSKNTQLVLTPIMAKKYSGLNRSIVDTRKNSLQMIQSRSLNHSVIWNAEKMVSVALIVLIPGCLSIGGAACDNILALVTTLHMHWGVEAVIVDYIRPSLCGNVIPVIARSLVYVFSAITLAGLFYFNANDMGLSKAIRRLWAITSVQPPPPETPDAKHAK